MRGDIEQSQAVLRAILESPRDIVIFALDREFRYLAFNRNHARTIKHIWGVDIHVGDSMLAVIKRDDDREKARRNFERALAGESFTLREEYGDERMQRSVYENVYSSIHDDRGEVIGLTVFLTDVTEQTRVEAQLEHYRNHLEELVRERTRQLEAAHSQLLYAQKLESLGILAGGVAHDFNNLLAVILARAELAAPSLPEAHPALAHLETIRETSLEARMLTAQLLAYSGKGRFMIQPVDMRELVESMAPLLRASTPKSVVLDFDLLESPLVAQLDLTQARQVVLNLVTNAAEAIDGGSGGVVVRTRRVVFDEALRVDGWAGGDLRAGSYAGIDVQDTGCGMDREVQAKLFDPFFTTKIAGRGLGLAAVMGIVKSHHGAILVRTSPNQGSVFTVLFPEVDLTPVHMAQPTPLPRADFRGQGVAMVVDDDRAVRAATSEMLASLGYEVVAIESGEGAVAALREDDERFCLVLLDLTMPGLSGEQTLRALKAIRPDIRVIAMTGYAPDEARLRFVRGELAGFLTKPFVRDELVEALRCAVEG